jgi:predicted nucleotidyltransferase
MRGPAVSPELLNSVIAHFAPQRVILFGSTTRGEAVPQSDIDLLVVLDDDIAPEQLTATAIHAARAGHHDPVDIIPCRALVLRARRPSGRSPISPCGTGLRSI